MSRFAVTAVIPLFNKAAYVREALESVFGQTRQPAEVIIVDDGSTDGGDAIVESLARPGLTFVRQANAGPGAARNRGIALAQTPYVAFLDADDVWLPDHLARLEGLTAAHPRLPLYANALGAMHGPPPPVGAAGLIGNYASAWLDGLIVSTCAAMVDREAALAVGGFETRANRGEDLALWLKLTLDRPMAMGAGAGALYRQEASDLTRRPVQEPDAAMIWIGDYLRTADPSPARRQLLSDYCARLALLHAAEWIRFGGRAEARAFLAMAAGTTRDARLLRRLSALAGPLWPLRRAAIGLRRLLPSARTRL